MEFRYFQKILKLGGDVTLKSYSESYDLDTNVTHPFSSKFSLDISEVKII